MNTDADGLPTFAKGQTWAETSARKMNNLTETVRGLRRESDPPTERETYAPGMLRRAKLTGYAGASAFAGKLVTGSGLLVNDRSVIFQARVFPPGDNVATCLPRLEDVFNSTDPRNWPVVEAFQEVQGNQTVIVWYLREPLIGTCQQPFLRQPQPPVPFIPPGLPEKIANAIGIRNTSLPTSA